VRLTEKLSEDTTRNYLWRIESSCDRCDVTWPERSRSWPQPA